VDLEQARSISSRFVTPGNHPSDLGLLLRRELGTASAYSPFLAGSIQSDLRALPKHGAFEFSKRPDHLHHHATCRCGCVDRFGQAAKSGFGLSQPFHYRYDIAERTGEPVKFPDDKNVALWELI
jgi:hypothetical protein